MQEIASRRPLLSVVVPTFNEGQTIESLLRRVAQVSTDHHIIAVDDGSTDNSEQVLANWSAAGNGLAAFHGANRGKGRAIRTGLELADGKYVIVQDADLEYDPGDYQKLLGPLLDGSADLVLGSRYLHGHVKGTGLLFRMGVSALNVAVRLLFGVRLTDEATCYKMMSTETLRQMDLQCERFEFCPEVIAKACRMGLRIIEVPISYHPRTAKAGKKIRLRDGWSAMLTLWRWRKWEPQVNRSAPDRQASAEQPANERFAGGSQMPELAPPMLATPVAI